MSIFNKGKDLEIQFLRNELRKVEEQWKQRYETSENVRKEIKRSIYDYKKSIQKAFTLQIEQPENAYKYERRLVVKEITESIATGRPLGWRLCDICNKWVPDEDIRFLSKPTLNEEKEENGSYNIRYCKNSACGDKAEKLLRDYHPGRINYTKENT